MLDDPLWLVAFPIYYSFMMLYGLFATVYYLPSIKHASGDPALAEVFGMLITISCSLGLIGSLVTIFRGHDRLEEIGGIAVVAMMLLYFISLSILIGVVHDPGTRPGSSFVPMVFAVFPAVRVLVIRRRRRIVHA